MSDNKFNHISTDLNTAAEATEAANDAGLIKTGKASGWLGFLGAIASIFASKKSGRN